MEETNVNIRPLRVDVGPGERFLKVQDAVRYCEGLPERPAVIHIRPGTYYEKVELRRGNIVIEGEGAERTVITYDDCANAVMPNGEKRGTFRSYTVLAAASDVCFRDLTVENSAGPREGSGQCVALYAEGDGILVERCRLVSCQDTLFTGPLPAKELLKNGFVGPTQGAPRVNGRQYYFDCYICGTVDFIFGSATAYFEGCVVESILRPGYVTAASTPEGQKYGYVFNNCRFIGDKNAAPAYLGRPWREHARTVILRSYLGEHIRDDKWHDWGKEQAHTTAYYAEYENTGPGAAGPGVPWAHVLTPEEAREYTLERIGCPEWVKNMRTGG